jgi:hypothetical protein
LGGLAGAIAPLLLASAGAAIAPLLLLSAGAIAGAAGAGAAAGVALSELLQAVSMTAAAARALSASFVFIDESPNLYKKQNRACEFKLVCEALRTPNCEFYRVFGIF